MPDELDNIINLAAAREEAPWFRRCQKNKDGEVIPTLANALIILANDPKLKGLLGFNEFTSQYLLMSAPPTSEESDTFMPGPYPRGWGAEDVSLVQAYFQRVWCNRYRRNDVESAMIAHAANCRFHPIRDYLDGLVWDGVKRLNQWIFEVFDPDPDDGDPNLTIYYQAVGRKFLIAAVRRIRQPGCKFDTMPIFEGLQGLGKSRVLRCLAGDEHFSDAIPSDLAHKEAAHSLAGIWVMEFAEIEHLIRNETETVKAFFSRQVDRYRPPYAKDFVMRPRQGVMAGTTNGDDYLRDQTGNRRFWPIPCRRADHTWIEANRDQLWAEACVAEAEGEPIWMETEDLVINANRTASKRMSDEAWGPAIEDYLVGKSRDTMTAARIMEDALKLPAAQMTKSATMRVASVLSAMGWRRLVKRDGGRTYRVWTKVEGEEGGNDEDVTNIPF
jgi:putative DNA primase/helicase